MSERDIHGWTPNRLRAFLADGNRLTDLPNYVLIRLRRSRSCNDQKLQRIWNSDARNEAVRAG